VVLAQATLNSVRLKLGVMGKASRFQELPSSEACLFEEVCDSRLQNWLTDAIYEQNQESLRWTPIIS
jgi:hypothetical protein